MFKRASIKSFFEHTSIVEGLNTIQVLIHLVLDSVQFGPCHASIDEGLSCLLTQKTYSNNANPVSNFRVYILKPDLHHITSSNHF